jgi:NAD-dependent DNA ligase
LLLKTFGKIFVVSGVFEKFSRDDWQLKAIGKVGGSISAKTDYVVQEIIWVQPN